MKGRTCSRPFAIRFKVSLTLSHAVQERALALRHRLASSFSMEQAVSKVVLAPVKLMLREDAGGWPASIALTLLPLMAVSVVASGGPQAIHGTLASLGT
jgi:hypothetical protein